MGGDAGCGRPRCAFVKAAAYVRPSPASTDRVARFLAQCQLQWLRLLPSRGPRERRWRKRHPHHWLRQEAEVLVQMSCCQRPGAVKRWQLNVGPEWVDCN